MHLKDLFVYVITTLGGGPLGYDYTGAQPPSTGHQVNLSQPDKPSGARNFGASNPRKAYGSDSTKNGDAARNPYDPYSPDSPKDGADARDPYDPFGTGASTDANGDNNPDAAKSSSEKTWASDPADPFAPNSSTKPSAPNDLYNLYDHEASDGAGDGFGPGATPYDTGALYGYKSDLPVKSYGFSGVTGAGAGVSSYGAANPYAPDSDPYVGRTERAYGENVAGSPKSSAGFGQRLGDSLYDPLAAPKTVQSLGGVSADPYSLSALPMVKAKSGDLGGDPGPALGLSPFDPGAGLTSATVFGAAPGFQAQSQSLGLGASLSGLSPTTPVSGGAPNNRLGSAMGPVSPDLGQPPPGGTLQ
jgi:hypothetical protein